MNAFELHPEAEADLDDIIAFIAQDSVDAAGRVLDEFDGVFALLAQRPGMGHRRSDLTSQGLRPLYPEVLSIQEVTSEREQNLAAHYSVGADRCVRPAAPLGNAGCL